MKYSKSIVKKIVDLYEEGSFSIEDICVQCNISKETFYQWKKTKADFSDALKTADDRRNESFKIMAKSGLAKLLNVFEYEEVSTDYENDANGKPVVKGQKRTKKFVMPNPTAVIFTLTNQDPTNWKHKQNVDVTSNGKGFFDFLKETSSDDPETEDE